MSKTFRSFHVRSASPATRIEQFQGRDHLVVPLVALVEGVIQATGASHPELVPADVFEKAPVGWNGRPVFVGHPVVNGMPVSGNTPGELERSAIGTIFNTKVVRDRLLMEAWLDIAKCETRGGDALTILNNARAGKVGEVSTGSIVSLDERAGVYNGQSFDAVWRELTPDHLAILPPGVTGACSVAMGCGTLRAADGSAVPIIRDEAPDEWCECGKPRHAPQPIDMNAMIRAMRGAPRQPTIVRTAESVAGCAPPPPDLDEMLREAARV